MYHVVACDLDGTLLSPDHRLTPYTREILKRLTSRGIHFVFATGRHHVDVFQMRDSLAINAYMITSNGARVHNIEGDLIFSHNIDEDIARTLCMLAPDDPQILTNLYRNDDWCINRHNKEGKAYFRESVFHYELFEPGSFDAQGISKVFFTCAQPDKLILLEKRIKSLCGDKVNVCFSLPTCLEVMAAGISKGYALNEVSKLLGYSLRSCVAFGDGLNDKEMLEMAGKGCIMGNADPRLKDMLPQLAVIGTNAEDAVPHALTALFPAYFSA